MRKALAFLFCLLATASFAQIAVQYSPADFIGYAPGAQQINLTPLWQYTANGSNIVHSGPRSFSTGTIIDSSGRTHTGIPGTLIVSNVLLGGYKIDFFLTGNPSPVATFTNLFTNGSPAFVNGNEMFGVSTNSVLEDGYAYTIAQMDNITSNLQYEIDHGTGGSGITLSQGTNIVNGSTGVIATNGAARGTTFIFASSGTNAIQTIAQLLISSASNVLATSSAALGANLTNDVNTTSNALVGTAQGLSNTSSNAVLANAQTAINASSNSIIATEQTAINSASNSVYGSSLTQINATSNTLAGVDATKAAAATTLTFNGTANQITSSAGAQDLSANRIWTFSLPSIMIAPGTFAAAGITNSGVYYGNGSGVTNLITGSILTGTNLTLSFNGSEQMFIVTNDGPDIFFTAPSPAYGHTGFLIQPSSGGHVTLHMPYSIKFYLNATNNLATNATLYFDCWNATNYGRMLGSILETQ